MPRRIVVREQTLDLGHQGVGFGEVDETDGAAANLVFIGRADAAAGGTDLEAGIGVFADAVKLAMERQDQRRVVGNAQDFGGDLDALAAQLRHFLDEVVRIDDDTIADDRELALNQTRGEQRQLVADAIDDQSMTGIVTAMEAHDDVGALRKPIHDLALALVAPLRADDNHIRHSPVFLKRKRAKIRRDEIGPAGDITLPQLRTSSSRSPLW